MQEAKLVSFFRPFIQRLLGRWLPLRDPARMRQGWLLATPLPSTHSSASFLSTKHRLPLPVAWPEWNPNPVKESDSCDTTRLTLLLENGTELELNRQSQEAVGRTVRRLILNLSKKNLLSNNSENSSSSNAPTLLCDNQPVDETLVGSNLWKQATTAPCQLIIDDLVLQVWSYPPTVISVDAFEQFEGSVFAQVPVTVSVKSLYVDTVEVEWLVNDCSRQTTTTHHCFRPSNTDVGNRLSVKVTPFRNKVPGRAVACQFAQTVQTLPKNTVLETRKKWLQTTKNNRNNNDGTIRLVSYNVLAQQNAFSTTTSHPVYPYVSRDILLKSRRLPLVVDELLSYQADVLCLQEVDQSVYYDLLQPVLSANGFQGYYTKKTTEQKEGCALFWNLSVFHDVPADEHKWFEISRLFSPHDNVDNDCWPMKELNDLALKRPDFYNAYSTLGHVFQMVPLQRRDSTVSKDRVLWIINTHLYFHPCADHIRLLQMYLLARQVDEEIKKVPGEVVIAGDFNSSLRNAAGKLLLDRRIPNNFRRLNEHLNTLCGSDNDTPQQQQQEDEFPELALPNSFPAMVSAVQPAPVFTHLIHGFQGTLDHILVSSPGLDSIRSAPMLSYEDATAHVAMPSAELPSDHVSLVCDICHSSHPTAFSVTENEKTHAPYVLRHVP